MSSVQIVGENRNELAKLELAQIKVDERCQLRAACSAATVAEYADALVAGAVFPPVTVFRDGAVYWLADGFHRFDAHRQAGRSEITADVRNGTKRDAILYAAAANADHGLRRTTDDKRRAIMALLSDPEWRVWSDREIATRTKTDHKTVGKLRKELAGGGVDGEIPIERRFVTRHGTEAVRKVTPPASQTPMSVTDKFLRNLPDDVLVAEAKRRGLVFA